MTQESESIITSLVLPLVQQWAERSGNGLLVTILSDKQFQTLAERYGQQLVGVALEAMQRPRAVHDGRPRREPPFVERERPETREDPVPRRDEALAALDARLTAFENEYQLLERRLEGLQQRIAPLAGALGACEECLGSSPECPRCQGQGAVGSAEPALHLLETEVATPLKRHGFRVSRISSQLLPVAHGKPKKDKGRDINGRIYLRKHPVGE